MKHRLLVWNGKEWVETLFETEDPKAKEVEMVLNDHGVHATLIKKPSDLEANIVKALLEI